MSSWAKLKSRADAGCVWCRLLLDLDVAQDDDPDKTVTITVRGGGLTKKCHDESDPYQKYQEVEVEINENATSMIIYAAPDDPAAHYITKRSPILDVKSPRALDLARQLINEIDPHVLPLTIRDAIYVTHKLGFRWLWVDSLCIIQDSDEDKAHEIGRMHHIYRYAHVTIMAGSAEGVDSGFLQERSPPDDVALPFICPSYPPNFPGCHDGHSAPRKFQVGQVYLTRGMSDCNPYSDELGSMAARAWCMQEYLLSPRALIFTPRTLLFKCLTISDMASVGNSYYSVYGEPLLPTSLFLPPTAPAAASDDKWWPPGKDMYRAWMRVVEDYTRRAASDESDKLVACAAIAEEFHRVLGSEYLAGLWRSDAFIVYLLWAADHSKEQSLGCRHTRPAAYRAPSWSWAAVDGEINHFHASKCALSFASPRTVVLAEVTQCWVTLEDPTLRFGRVTDGALALRGTLIPCHGGLAERSPDLPDSWTVPLPFFEDKTTFLPTDPRCSALVTMDCDVDELPGRMWFSPFVRTKWNTYQDDMLGVVLELARPSNSSGSASEKICFRRIGAFRDFVTVARPGENFRRHLLWDPLTRAVKMGELPWMDIEIEGMDNGLWLGQIYIYIVGFSVPISLAAAYVDLDSAGTHTTNVEKLAAGYAHLERRLHDS
ncbi:hypothetical protein VTO73DRAFT_5337 [Trametes versicolor]